MTAAGQRFGRAWIGSGHKIIACRSVSSDWTFIGAQHFNSTAASFGFSLHDSTGKVLYKI
jgi:hypothetical protein